MRLAWLSDIHLDHCNEWRRYALAEECAAKSDAAVITGDITSGTELQLLAEFATDYAKPVHFVLGNHDYWSRSFADVAADIRGWCSRKSNLTWLDDVAPVPIAPGVQLCGIGGWYDAQFGDPEAATFIMNDWIRIADLRPHYYAGSLVAKCRGLGLDSAMKATALLQSTDAARVFFATHVPPFKESSQYEGKQSDEAHLPWYTNKAMGYALTRFSKSRPSVRLTTLCGHCHSHSTMARSANHTVMVAGADYGSPAIAEVFEL